MEAAWPLTHSSPPEHATPAPGAGTDETELVEPEPEPTTRRLMLQRPSALVPGLSKTYSRRQQQRPSATADPEAGQVEATPSLCSSPNSSQRKRFMAKISKKTTMILPTPRTAKLHPRACAPTAPRRSRRIAGMAPETPGGSAPTRTKKKVMRALGLISDTGGIDRESLEKYGLLFTQASSLPDAQVRAMCALFGWTTPEGEEASGAAAC